MDEQDTGPKIWGRYTDPPQRPIHSLDEDNRLRELRQEGIAHFLHFIFDDMIYHIS